MPDATPWTTEDPAALQIRVDSAKLSFGSQLNKFIQQRRVPDFVICWLFSKGITEPWEVAGLAQEEDGECVQSVDQLDPMETAATLYLHSSADWTRINRGGFLRTN